MKTKPLKKGLFIWYLFAFEFTFISKTDTKLDIFTLQTNVSIINSKQITVKRV